MQTKYLVHCQTYKALRKVLYSQRPTFHGMSDRPRQQGERGLKARNHTEPMAWEHTMHFENSQWRDKKKTNQRLCPFLPPLSQCSLQFSSVQFTQSCSTLCDPMNHSTPRPPCPSPTPRVHSNSCPSSQ